eukprot:2158356-Pleurochrysis_carterae.AAC.2
MATMYIVTLLLITPSAASRVYRRGLKYVKNFSFSLTSRYVCQYSHANRGVSVIVEYDFKWPAVLLRPKPTAKRKDKKTQAKEATRWAMQAKMTREMQHVAASKSRQDIVPAEQCQVLHCHPKQLSTGI